jgi:hypothetical protein
MNTLLSGSIATWDQHKRAILSPFFLLPNIRRKGEKSPVFNMKSGRTSMMHERDTSCFLRGVQQEDRENHYDAWERYKLVLKRSPSHKFSKMEVTLIFTNGLKTQTRLLLDASVGGSMKNKQPLRYKSLLTTCP